ncbi:MAG: FAD-dependent oxidoreductase, partial [bacterium]
MSLINNNYEVIVVGSGPSGMGSAIYAAKNGARTLLIEKNGFLGGMSTTGMLNVFCGSASSALFTDIKEKLVVNKRGRKIYEPEELKNYYLNQVKENNVDVLLYSYASDIKMKENYIESINIETKSGSKEIKSKIFIDATGDGDIANRANVPYYKGRESDGKMEPASLMVKVGGINPEKAVYPTFGRQKELQQKMRKEVEKGNIPFPAGHIIIIETTVPEMAILNMTNSINIDGTKPEDLTEAEFKCREQNQPIIKFVRENVPGFKNCYLVGTASHIGIRETRHFSGLYRLKEEDIAAGKIFDDWVVSRCNRNFGAHNLSGSGSDEQNQKLESSEYTIPYRSFLPKKVDNLYLTGRCISG